MNHKLATAMAVVLVAGMAGLSATPTAAAVDPDCDKDFDITDSLDERMLSAGEIEVGLSVVQQARAETLLVELETDGVTMNFGIFEEIEGDCTRSPNVSPNCSGDVQLSTTGPQTVDLELCTLQPGLSVDREFFVVFENPHATKSLNYSVGSF